MFRLPSIRRRLRLVRYLNLSYRAFINGLPRRVNRNRYPILRLNLNYATSVPARASGLIVVHRLTTRKCGTHVLLHDLRTGIRGRRVPTNLCLLTNVICPTTIILRHVRATRVPKRTRPHRMVNIRFVFRRVRSQVTMYPLCGGTRAQRRPNIRNYLLLIRLLSLHVMPAGFKAIIRLPICIFFNDQFRWGHFKERVLTHGNDGRTRMYATNNLRFRAILPNIRLLCTSYVRITRNNSTVNCVINCLLINSSWVFLRRTILFRLFIRRRSTRGRLIRPIDRNVRICVLFFRFRFQNNAHRSFSKACVPAVPRNLLRFRRRLMLIFQDDLSIRVESFSQ